MASHISERKDVLCRCLKAKEKKSGEAEERERALIKDFNSESCRK